MNESQKFIAAFQEAYNKGVINNKFEYDMNLPYEFNTSLFIDSDSAGTSYEYFVSLVDDESFILFGFDKSGETEVEFQFVADEMSVEQLVVMVKALLS